MRQAGTTNINENIATTGNAFLLAKKAIALMARHDVPPLPENYAIWFRYVSHEDSAMNKEIDLLISQIPEFSEETSSYLYNKYLNDTNREALDKSVDQAHAILADVMMIMGSFNQDASQKGDAMAEQAKAMQGIHDINDLKSMAQQVIDGALELKKNGASMQIKLQESREEIDTLKTTLEKAANETERDFLTNILNRKGFERLLGDCMEESCEKNTPLALLVLDIDHFKNFNDMHGHLIGDEVLKVVAKCITNCVKGMDIAARYGGEEFVVILPATPIQGGVAVAEAIRNMIASKELKKRQSGDSYGQITVSVGVSVFREGDTLPSFLKRADDALYAAKRAGRNRVVVEQIGS